MPEVVTVSNWDVHGSYIRIYSKAFFSDCPILIASINSYFSGNIYTIFNVLATMLTDFLAAVKGLT